MTILITAVFKPFPSHIATVNINSLRRWYSQSGCHFARSLTFANLVNSGIHTRHNTGRNIKLSCIKSCSFPNSNLTLLSKKFVERCSCPIISQKQLLRRFSTSSHFCQLLDNDVIDFTLPEIMSVWHIHEYGKSEQLQLSYGVHIPVLQYPDDVFIEVHAASINPVDIMILGGYGSSVLNVMRKISGSLTNGSEFPLTLGRDFSGIVSATGQGVPPDQFKPGDEVWGAGNVARQGTHAEYHVISAKELAKKPTSLSHVEAASIPYVASTAWSSLCTTGGINKTNAKLKRILVLGGSGGVGSFAIQLLKAWNARVVTTCSEDAIDKCLALGADIAFDYRSPNLKQDLQNFGSFDLIFDTVGGYESLMELLLPSLSSKYVSIVTPFLKNFDDHGMLGILPSVRTFGCGAAQALKTGAFYGWGFFMPNGKAMQTVAELVDSGKIQPVIERVFTFDEVPAAYDKVASLHNRGKTVIDLKPNNP